MKLTNIALAIILLMPVMLVSCEKNDADNRQVMCTMEFKTISVGIATTGGSPVVLDSFRVTNTLTGTVVKPFFDTQMLAIFASQGYYPIATDNQQRTLKDNPTPFEFKGFLKGVEVAKTTLTVGADDCHIMLVSGNPNITLTTH